MKNKIIAIAKAEVGKYKEGSNNKNPYSHDMDNKYWQFFNYKKEAAGTAYCAIGVCWTFCEYFGDKDKARKFLGCPEPTNNCAAGVKYLHQYVKKTGTTIGLKDGKSGDLIFFRNDAHVGIIEKIANGYYHTIEWNKGGKSSDCVARGKYKIGSSNVTGIVRPNYPIEPTPPTPKPTKREYPVIPNPPNYFKRGDRSAEVQKMQRILEAVIPGCLAKCGGCDGILGQGTSQAVYLVQSKLNLVRDHLYGPKTQAACKKYLGDI